MIRIRGSLDHTIMQLNQKIIAHQVIQDPFTVTHQQREERMFDREHNTQREDSIFLTLYHLLHGSNTVFTSTIGCKSFQTSVTVFQVYLFARICQHMFQGLTGISCSHDCKKVFQVSQTLAFDGVSELLHTDMAHTCISLHSSSSSSSSASTARALAFAPRPDRHTWLRCLRLPQRLQFSFRREQSGLR